MIETINITEIFSITNIMIYVLIINLIAFLAMWIDKRKAEKGAWRIKEYTLFMFVILGGGIGGILGMYVFHHKTKKLKFKIGFPAILIMEIIVVVRTILMFK